MGDEPVADPDHRLELAGRAGEGLPPACYRRRQQVLDLEHYLDVLSEHVAVDRAEFRTRYVGFVLIRLMQAMGAHGYRGFFERKRRFLESVPNAARNLDQLLTAGLPIALPELERVFHHIATRWSGPLQLAAPPSGLVVLIQSFSFRDGYPPDAEGHGGGFVFDCRALPNPYHEPALRDLTGEADAVHPERDMREPAHAPPPSFLK